MQPHHEQGRRDLIGHSPAGGLVARPKFEILAAVVCPIPVAVVDALLRSQWASETTREDKAVLGCGGLAADQPAILLGHGNPAVAMGQVLS